MGGISSSMVSWNGLPVFSHSARTRSSARASSASAMRMRASDRSEGVVRFQEVKASAATRTARSTSAGPRPGPRRTASPVLGLISGAIGPSSASQKAPPMKFCNLRMPLPSLVPLVRESQNAGANKRFRNIRCLMTTDSA